jgi:GT2 family glycosyltransferase
MIYISVCSRSTNKPKSLKNLIDYCNRDFLTIRISYDSTSIYEGHKENIEFFKTLNLQDEDIIVLCHDDVDILSKQEDLLKYLNLARRPGTGFIGVAGGTYMPNDGAWWNSRRTGDSRGMVFQGISHITMQPNYFGKCGQAIFMDGCFLAATYSTIKKIGLDQPDYLETGWDFYDIHLTYKAYLDGFTNYVVPIMIMHESPGMMREGWHIAKEKFLRHHASTIHRSKLVTDKTHGLPEWNT